MKRLLSILCAMTICLSLAGCGEAINSNDQNNQVLQHTTTTKTTESTTTTTTTTTKKVTTTTAPEYKSFFDFTKTVIIDEMMMFFVGTNSVGGLQYVFAAEYTGDKEIKYYTITYSMTNAVGDPAKDDIKHKSSFSKKYIGPLKKGDYILDISKDDPSVYCKVVDKISLDTINIEYMDGTEETFDFYTTFLDFSIYGLERGWVAAFSELDSYGVIEQLKHRI